MTSSHSKYQINGTTHHYDSKSTSRYLDKNSNHNHNHIVQLLIEKLTKDLIYAFGNSNHKPNWNINEYAKDIIKEIGKHQFENVSIIGVAHIFGKSVIAPMKVTYAAADFSSCMNHEITYLIENNIYFNDNHKIAKNICIISTLNATFSSEMKLIGSVTSTVISTSAQVYLEKNYLDKPLQHGWFRTKFNSVENMYNKYVSFNIYKLIDNTIHKPITFAIDYVVDKSFQLADKVHSKIKKKDNAVFEIAMENQSITNDIVSIDQVNDDKMPDINDVIVKPVMNFDKINTILTNTQTLLNIVMIFEKFKHEPHLIIVELEKILVNVKCDNSLFAGIFTMIADMAINEKITPESIKIIIGNIISKTIDFPMHNIINLIDDIINANDITRSITRVIIDVISAFIPGVGIINIIHSIKQMIEAMFTRQHIIQFGNIEAVYTDKLKIGFFKIRHQVSIDNDFFDIHISCEKRHASDAKKILIPEFERQMVYRSYQVIGIPIEFLNDSYDKPVTRYENFKLATYIGNLKQFWFNVNEKYLTEEQKNAMKHFYFMNEDERTYRYELMKQGLTPSWIYEHKHDTVIEFCYQLYHKSVNIIVNKLDFTNVNFSLNGFNSLFDQFGIFFSELIKLCKPSPSTKITDPETYFNDIRITGWNNATTGRKQIVDSKLVNSLLIVIFGDELTDVIGDNDLLTKYREKETDDYNNDVGNYSKNALLKLSAEKLWEIQQSIEYLYESVCSSFINSIGRTIAYIDEEFMTFIWNPLTYLPSKMKQLSFSIVQYHTIKTISHQIFNLVSLLDCTQSITDEIMIMYYAPIINCGVSMAIYSLIASYQIIRYGNKYMSIGDTMMNIAIPLCLNTGISCMYSYASTKVPLVIDKIFGFGNSIISYIISNIDKSIIAIIGPEIITTLIITVGINLGMRMIYLLYDKYIKYQHPIQNKINLPVFEMISNSEPVFMKISTQKLETFENDGMNSVNKDIAECDIDMECCIDMECDIYGQVNDDMIDF